MSTFRIRPSLLIFLILLNAGALLGYFSAFHRNAAPLRIHTAASSSEPTNLRLPDFSLIDSTGSPVTRADLMGRPWIAAFIYADCPAQCPMLTTKMSALQNSLPSEVGLVSFSVDPEKDTPEALAVYARRFHADSSRWKFLTGSKQETEKIITALGAPKGVSREAHSIRLYLLDRSGAVVGLFDTANEGSLENLSREARRLSTQEK